MLELVPLKYMTLNCSASGWPASVALYPNPSTAGSAMQCSPHARSTHAMVSVAHLLQEQLTPVRHPRVAQAHCASSCSCPLPAQDWQGSRAVHLSSAMQRLSCQGCRADHLLSVRPWIAGHRPKHLLVCLSLWHDVLLHRVSQFTHVILYLQSAGHACLLVWSGQYVDMVHTLVASCAQHFASPGHS